MRSLWEKLGTIFFCMLILMRTELAYEIHAAVADRLRKLTIHAVAVDTHVLIRRNASSKISSRFNANTNPANNDAV
jgi:hypothetical protein